MRMNLTKQTPKHLAKQKMTPGFFGKLLSMVGLLSLLLGCVSLPALGAAETTPSVRIEHHNLAFGNEVYLLYAVKTEGVGKTDKPFMEFRVENEDLSSPDAVCREFEYRPLDEGDTEPYYIFAFTKLNAAQMADTVYARAGVTVDGVTYYSETDAYSICEYAAGKLGLMREKTATEDQALRELLQSMLEYGSMAQKYLKYRTDCLATEYCLTFGEDETPTAGIRYETKADGTAEVVGYDGTEGRVVIARADPETGLRVTSIRAKAFMGNKTITEVVIPETVETIGDEAFKGCTNLKKVSLPASLTKLGKLSLPDGDQLERLYYAGTVKQLETLMANSAGWAMTYQYFFVCGDGKEYRHYSPEI